MRWFGDVQEVLGVSAPELVLLASLSHSLASSSLSSPFALELLFQGRWQLSQFNVFRGKHSQEEWSLLFFFVDSVFGVRHNNVVHISLVMDWVQIGSLSDFSLGESLNSFCSFKNYIVFIDFPETLSLRLDSDYHEVYRDVGSL